MLHLIAVPARLAAAFIQTPPPPPAALPTSRRYAARYSQRASVQPPVAIWLCMDAGDMDLIMKADAALSVLTGQRIAVSTAEIERELGQIWKATTARQREEDRSAG